MKSPKNINKIEMKDLKLSNILLNLPNLVDGNKMNYVGIKYVLFITNAYILIFTLLIFPLFLN